MVLLVTHDWLRDGNFLSVRVWDGSGVAAWMATPLGQYRPVDVRRNGKA